MLRCHDKTYIERLKTLSSKDILASDTYHNEHTLLAAKIAAECALNLAKRLLSVTKTKSNGYAVIRPPGHHCSHAKTHGFCVLNNAAIAARHASCEKKKRVVVFDWDVHHGDGTERILRDDPNVLYISVRVAFDPITHSLTYTSKFRYIVTKTASSFRSRVQHTKT